ncbi:ABC transporter substrate-binding protein [Curvivirga sp.]|uniref:ABC transporter substrate-binding protein n=1 Tax=Curvivirga sp. TaxID=2856848 RepID=UPI003B5C3364
MLSKLHNFSAAGLLATTLIASATFTATNLSTAMADENIMTVAVPFGPKGSVPDPRARQNGWISNRAGVSETLIGLTYDMQQAPRLAVSYDQISPTEWKIGLRKGVKFHDGSAMTAQDVKASFEKLSEEGHSAHNPRLVKLLGIKEIKIVDDHTLVFETNTPNSAFLWSLTEPSAAVMKEGTKELPLIGTGPFVFKEAETGKFYRTVGFDQYWGGKPNLDGLVLDTIPDPSVAALALRSGDVDVVTNFNEQEFDKVKQSGDFNTYATETLRLFFIQPQTEKGPLKHKVLRQAISLGLDRDLMVQVALANVGGAASKSIFPQQMKSWVNKAVDLPFNVEKAKEILDAAGIKDSDGNGIREVDGADIVLKVRSYEGRPALKPSLEITQALLQQIGIGAEVSMGEWGANNASLEAGEIDMHLQAWGTAPQGDPDYFPSTLVQTGAKYNVSGYSNSLVDKLLEQGRNEFDNEKRKVFYDEVQEIINEELPLIPLFHKTQVSVSSKAVEGYKIHPAETYLATPELTLVKE